MVEGPDSNVIIQCHKKFGGWGPSAGKTKYQNKGQLENFRYRAILCLDRCQEY